MLNGVSKWYAYFYPVVLIVSTILFSDGHVSKVSAPKKIVQVGCKNGVEDRCREVRLVAVAALNTWHCCLVWDAVTAMNSSSNDDDNKNDNNHSPATIERSQGRRVIIRSKERSTYKASATITTTTEDTSSSSSSSTSKSDVAKI